MNYRIVLSQLGLLLIVLALLIGLAAAWSGLDLFLGDERERRALQALGAAAAASGLFGLGLWLPWRRARFTIERREAMLLVALSWLAGGVVAAAPFYIWAHWADGVAGEHRFQSWINCYFEAISGLTTTGATVLVGIEELPRGLLLWRSATQWLGGLGIVVLFVAVLPSLGVNSRKLYQFETSGPTRDGLHPRIRDTARILWVIYLGLTIAEIIALRLTGLSWFDAVNHTFTTVASGGFSTSDASIGQYRSVAVELVLIVFMVAGGMNFAVFIRLVRGDASVLRDTELRVYLLMLLVAGAAVAYSIAGEPIVLTTGQSAEGSAGEAVRQAAFTTASLQTTTGYCTSDFNRWPSGATSILILVMLVGGCAGSTAGGLKVVRLWLVLKVLFMEIERVFRPHVVRPLRIGRTTYDVELRLSTVAYVVGAVALVSGGTAALLVLEPAANIDIQTAFTSSLASFTTVGPGLGRVGALGNYGWMGDASKLVVIALMLMGRLEIFAIIVLFSPRFWRGD